jgi:hypothetical protein
LDADHSCINQQAQQKTRHLDGLNAQDRGRTIADSSEKSSDSARGAAKSAAIDLELAAIIKSAIIAVARQHLTEQ